MKVVFRVDASVQMGSGHLMRCLTLAEALQDRGVETRFICGDHDGNLNAWVQGKGVPVTVLRRAWLVDAVADAEQTILALGAVRPDWMVVDHYGLDVEWEQRLKPFVGRLLVIDDHTGRSHDCDVLLDQNYSEEGAQWYVGLIPAACKMLLGPDYAQLRKEFGELRGQVSRRQILENLLVFFTAGDDQGETLKAMRGIEIFGQAKRVDVVLGRSNPHNAAIKQKCDELHWGYHCQVDYMPALIAQADLVIGAGGSSNWERCALGVPALVAILADNQVTIAQALDSAGVVRNLGWFHALTPTDYADALCALDTRLLADMSGKSMRIVDAAGAKRVADYLLYSNDCR
jgi:UDP-2,4-diacetamido-2,4,6-trideoxy-beta-L-altropyranose hydrolase